MRRKESFRAKKRSLRRANSRIHQDNVKQIPRGGIRL